MFLLVAVPEDPVRELGAAVNDHVVAQTFDFQSPTVSRVEQVHFQDDQFNADLTQVLGYLNFSSGKPDTKTLAALNRLYGRAVPGTPYEGLPAYLQSPPVASQI